MKVCTRFHFEDVEHGDKLFLGEGSVQEGHTFRDPDVTIVVARAYKTKNFGEVVEDTAGETYYLSDYGIVRQADVQKDGTP